MQEYRKYRTEIEVGYLSKPEGTTDMGTKWAIKRDTLCTYIKVPVRTGEYQNTVKSDNIFEKNENPLQFI